MKLSSTAVRDPGVKNHNAPHQVPIVAASSFVFDSLEEGIDIFDGRREGHIYGRFGNPTIDAAASKIAALEGYGLDGPTYGLFCASGMAAIATTLLGICDQGDAVLSPGDLYGGTDGLLDQLKGKGLRRVTSSLRDPERVGELLSDGDIRVVYIETPSNPTLHCTDVGKLADVVHHHGALLVVDNTFATPVLQQPLAAGADLVVHSTTKYMNGHGSGVAGAVVCRDEALFRERLVPAYRLFGGSGNPWDAWLVLNGLKTLPLRMERHSKNALAVATYLERHDKVARVNYPGLLSHPDRAVIEKQLSDYGGMLSFELKGGLQAGTSFMNALDFCTITPTLGDVDTLVLHPATMSHRGIDPEVRRAHDITDGLIRMSVGIEAIEDILADIERALR